MGRGPREKDEREGESGSAGKGEKGEEAGGLVGQQAKMERGRGWKWICFSFSKSVFQIHFQKKLNSFELWIKTNQHNKRISAAWMHKHVANLMINFNFTKNIISYIWNAHIIA
jgi:hypothetical protein